MNKILEEVIDNNDSLESELNLVHLLRGRYLYGRPTIPSTVFENALDEAIELGVVDIDQLRVTTYR